MANFAAMRITTLSFVLALHVACASDNGVTGLCGIPESGFDIEEASTLEDAQGYPYMHDAVVLDYNDASLAAGDAWRVRSVEIMPMIGKIGFDFFSDGQQVTVEIWDANNPQGTPYKVTQTFRKDDHDWERVTLQNPSTAWETDQVFAWWEFDFSEVIPTTGMTEGEYLVSVAWDGSGLPAVGYSNFNNPCDKNWTDYGDGFGWVLNSDMGSLDECSWPMIRVEMEVITRAVECEAGSVSID